MKKLFKNENCSAYVILDESTRKYFSNFSSSSGCVILAENKNYLIVDGRYFEAAKKQVTDFEVVLGKYSDFPQILLNIVKENRIKKLFFDENQLSFAEYEFFKKALNIHCKVAKMGDKIAVLKSQKTEIEIENTKKAQQICEKAFLEVVDMLQVGMTEKEVANEFEYRAKKYGADKMAFESIVAFGKNSSQPHHELSDKKLCENEVVLMDLGVMYKGYCSDMTRTFVFGKASAYFTKCYQIVLGAVKILEENVKSGMIAGDVDALARDYIQKFGYADNFMHGTGHGVGTFIHEYPSLKVDSKDVLLENAVVTFEPGIYIPNRFGIRIEDLVVIKKDGVQVLTSISKELFQTNKE